MISYMDRALKNMNRLVKKVLQMYIGIELNSMDEFDGWHPAKFLHTLYMPHAAGLVSVYGKLR